MRNVGAIDLFCGAGGLTRGLLDAGVSVLAGIDIDSASRHPYEHNNNVPFHQIDVRSLTRRILDDLWGDSEVRLLAGCAPCQPFSAYGHTRRDPEHKDWDLLREFARLIEETNPHLVTMENVPGLERQPVFQEFLESLVNYEVWYEVVSLDKIGVPQTRKRLVLLASRIGDAPKLAMSSEHVSVKDAIGDLGDKVKRDPLHVWASLSPTNLARIKHSKPGGTWRDWPEDLRAPCHRRASGSTYPSVYGRMVWEKPGPTITTQCYAYGSGRFGHPEEDRAISLREAALLQTFPEDYEFVEPTTPIHLKRIGRIIGNAVPPKLGMAIGETFRLHLQERTSLISSSEQRPL